MEYYTKMEEYGNKIKEVRNKKKMTLKDLSEKCDLSVAFLSQIERGLASPAISSLKSIANALDLDLSDFFDVPAKKPKTNDIITKSYEHVPFVVKHTNYIYSELSKNIENRKLEILHEIILPGKEENYPTNSSHKGEEFIYILEGVMTLIYDDKEYELYPGDSAHYLAKTPHTWRNYTNKVVKLISVNTPIIFKEL